MQKIPSQEWKPHLIILIVIYLLIQLPLANRPLSHDEIYNTYLYLHSSPFSKDNSEYSKYAQLSGLNWNKDWKRQIATHPPFLSFFYYFWIRIFGDSEISLHIPTIIAGLIGMSIFYLLGRNIFNPQISFAASLATVISLPYIVYSILAVHAIFETAVLILSIFILYKFLVSGRRMLFYYLMIVNLLGALIFYHYLVFFSLQTIIFWFYRKKNGIPIYYFIVFIAVLACFIKITHASYLEKRYIYEGWLALTPKNIIYTIIALPFRMNKEMEAIIQILRYYGTIIFLLFIIGGVFILLDFRKKKTTENIIKLILVPLSIIPFLIYLFISIKIKNFGQARNFFYLFPHYLLILCYAANRLIPNKKLFYSVPIILMVLSSLLCVSAGYRYWQFIYNERQMLRIAAQLNTPSIIISTLPFNRSAWPLFYYKEKYNIALEILRWDKATNNSDYYNFVRDKKKYAVIDEGSISAYNYPPYKYKNFKLVKISTTTGYYGPYQLLQKLINIPAIITIRFYEQQKY